MRFFDKTIHIHRNQTVMGQYNRPTHVIKEVGKCRGQIDRPSSNGGNTVVQTTPQAKSMEIYLVFAEPHADIRPNDWLVIDGVRYRAAAPTVKYRTHQEISVRVEEEI